MKSETHGLSTSAVEVTNILKHGFWLLLEGRELFLSFVDSPWFRRGMVEAILNVEQPHTRHLYWPDLDVDLAVESVEHSERYPLISRGCLQINRVSVPEARPESPEGASHHSPGQRPGFKAATEDTQALKGRNNTARANGPGPRSQ